MPKFGTQPSARRLRQHDCPDQKDEYPCELDGKDVQERIAGAPSEIISFNLWLGGCQPFAVSIKAPAAVAEANELAHNSSPLPENTVAKNWPSNAPIPLPRFPGVIATSWSHLHRSASLPITPELRDSDAVCDLVPFREPRLSVRGAMSGPDQKPSWPLRQHSCEHRYPFRK